MSRKQPLLLYIVALAAALGACTGAQPPADAAAPSSAVTVIDVTGLAYDDARRELIDLGLDVRRAEAPSPADRGTVAEQSLPPGEQVDRGATVMLTVSSGAVIPTSAPSEVPLASWTATYQQVNGGVVRIKSAACGEVSGTGSGFLVDKDLVATNAHVVEGSDELTVDSGGAVRTGDVIGIDRVADLALVRLSERLSGHVFQPADELPEVGSDVAVVGYPLGDPLSITTGAISGLERRFEGAPPDAPGMLQTDAAVNPGNSGGPLVDLDGGVVGIVTAKRVDEVNVAYAEGLAFALPAPAVFPQLDAWRDSPQIVEPPACETLQPDDTQNVTTIVDHPEADAVVATFQSYVDGINSGDYQSAYDQWAPRLQETTPYDQFVIEQTSSLVYDLTVTDIRRRADDRLAVDVEFWSTQAPEFGPDGQSCSVWALTYRMDLVDRNWLVAGARHTVDSSPLSCDDV